MVAFGKGFGQNIETIGNGLGRSTLNNPENTILREDDLEIVRVYPIL